MVHDAFLPFERQTVISLKHDESHSLCIVGEAKLGNNGV